MYTIVSYPPNFTVFREEIPEKAPFPMESTVLKYSMYSISNSEKQPIHYEMKGLLYCNGGTKIYMIIVVLHSDKAISDLLWKFLSIIRYV